MPRSPSTLHFPIVVVVDSLELQAFIGVLLLFFLFLIVDTFLVYCLHDHEIATRAKYYLYSTTAIGILIMQVAAWSIAVIYLDLIANNN